MTLKAIVQTITEDDYHKKNKRGNFLLRQDLRDYTPGWDLKFAVSTLSVIILIFAVLSVLITNKTSNSKEVKIDYTDCEAEQCIIEFEILEDMKLPLYFFYSMDHFYNNHRLYVKSRSYSQMKGNDYGIKYYDPCDGVSRNYEMVFNDTSKLVSINGTKLNPFGEAIPCGLIAKSMFNDTFQLFNVSGITLKTILNTSKDEKEINGSIGNESISEDLNPENINNNNNEADSVNSSNSNLTESSTKLAPVIYNLKEDELNIPIGEERNYYNDTNTIQYYMTKSLSRLGLNESNISTKFERDMFQNVEGKEGKQWLDVSNEHFINWQVMNTNNKWYKLWAHLKTDLKAGNYSVIVNNNFNTSIKAKKYFVIANTSFFGSSQFLGWVYMIAGIWLLFILFIVVILHLTRNTKFNYENLIWVREK